MSGNFNEKYLVDTLGNVLRWDKFHMINENWSDRYERNNVKGESEGIILEACDLYVLEVRDCDDNPGNKLMVCLIDPKDSISFCIQLT